ncbi:unnamed protein product, partial [Meganyctiphanes norvegica]
MYSDKSRNIESTVKKKSPVTRRVTHILIRTRDILSQRMVPRNPGVASYYKTFMETIYSHLEGSHAVWAISHAGHCQTSIKFSGPGVYDLTEQIKHKVSFLKEYIPAGASVTLVGHSIGCKIILDCIKTFKGDNGVSVTQSYLLFPTIERMKETPQGVKLWPMLCYFRWLVVLLAAIVNLLPSLFKHKLFRLFYLNVPSCCADATVELLHPNIVRNVLWMAFHELKEVRNPDLPTLDQFSNNILIYYGAKDGWCPLSFREELLIQLPNINSQICSMNIDHAFVLHSSEDMGKLLAQWMK